MTAMDRAREGHYNVSEPYPDRKAPDYQDQIRQRRQRDMELLGEFYRDLCKDHNLDSNSRIAQMIWSKAWEYGHASGLCDVAIEFDELVEFVNAVRNLS